MGSKGYSTELNRYGNWRSVTVTYKRADAPVIVTKVGWGDDYQAALRDADEQLRPGSWERLAIGQPSSVLMDVRNAGKQGGKRAGQRPGEGETVTVAPPETRPARGIELTDD